MERIYNPIDWSNFPPIEDCISFGDTNENHLNIEVSNINERVVMIDASKLAMPTSEEMQELQKYEVASGIYRIV